VFAPEPFVSVDEEAAGSPELADLDQGSTQDFPAQDQNFKITGMIGS
jgi:hypothetical protein